jgi:threonine synthase
MGMIKSLRCPKCQLDAPSKKIFRCPACRSILEVTVEIGHLTRSDLFNLRKSQDKTIWRWFDFMPVEHRASIVSLGEGYTPLINASRLGQKLRVPRLYLKNDTVLPTGSLKDRSNAVGISKAKELGFKTAAVISTGNAAASVAAYSAAAGLNSVVIVPVGTSVAKIVQAWAYGAAVIVVAGDFDTVVADVYRAGLDEFGWYDCLSSNPYRDEGKKSYAYEIFDQFDEHIPDWIIHPTAGGTGLYAMWKGFQELRALAWAHRAPKLAAAQSEAAAPIVAAFERNLADVEPVVARPTIAESIQVGNPISLGSRALAALRSSNGAAVALSDDEIIEAQSALARLAGIFAEPAAATSVAAAKRLREQGSITENDLVVCNITGHGLKQPSAIRIPEDQLQPVSPTLSALHKRLVQLGQSPVDELVLRTLNQPF